MIVGFLEKRLDWQLTTEILCLHGCDWQFDFEATNKTVMMCSFCNNLYQSGRDPSVYINPKKFWCAKPLDRKLQEGMQCQNFSNSVINI